MCKCAHFSLKRKKVVLKSFNIKIAGIVVEIESIYEYVYNFCKDYIVEFPCDFKITVSEKDIRYEREKSIKEAKNNENKRIEFSDSYLETLAVYRKIAYKMLSYDILLFHGSAIAVDNKAYLFIAKSGMGKSTHTKLWREYFKKRAVMVNDDKPMLKISDETIFVCGTPWDGKHKLSKNIMVPLKAIIILERDTINSISKINKNEALPMLYQQSFRPKDKERLIKVMKLIERLVEGVELYRLRCNMEKNSVIVSYNGMNEGEKVNEIKE